MKPRLLVIGGSYAALNAAAAAREAGFDGTLTMVSEETIPPYQRPPLSKGFLKGETEEAELPLKGETFYRDQAIDLILDNRVTSLDLHTRQAGLAGGETLAFDIAVVACGARPRLLPSGEDRGVLYLRSLADARRLKSRLESANSVIILGGGFVGLEVASAAAAIGKSVQLVEAGERLLARAVPAEVSALIAARHREAGVHFITGAAAEALDGRVRLMDGSILHADLVVAGLGAIPNTELAAEAGLVVNNGIEADFHGLTSAPNVYAVGDCSNHLNYWTGRRIRLESVQNAVDQARAVGATIAGQETLYTAMPRFWSDQYEMKLQMVGMAIDVDRTEVLTTPTGALSLLHMRGDLMTGVTSLNDLRTQVWARRALAKGPIPRTGLDVPEHLTPAPPVLDRQLSDHEVK